MDRKVKLYKLCYSDISISNTRLKKYLSHDEILKADSFITEALGHTFMIHKVFEKIVLKLESPDENFTIIKNNFGKPSLKDTPMLHYSKSHTNQYVAIAVSHIHIGLDIEECCNENNEDLYNLVFSNYDPCFLKEEVAFYHAWSMKEAYLKEHGVGLNYEMKRVILERKERWKASSTLGVSVLQKIEDLFPNTASWLSSRGSIDEIVVIDGVELFNEL